MLLTLMCSWWWTMMQMWWSIWQSMVEVNDEQLWRPVVINDEQWWRCGDQWRANCGSVVTIKTRRGWRTNDESEEMEEEKGRDGVWNSEAPEIVNKATLYRPLSSPSCLLLVGSVTVRQAWTDNIQPSNIALLSMLPQPTGTVFLSGCQIFQQGAVLLAASRRPPPITARP